MPRGECPGRRPAASDPQARRPDRTAHVTHLRGSDGRPPAARSPPAGGHAAGGRMRRLVVASAILATLLAAPLGLAAAIPASASAPTDSERATAALSVPLGRPVPGRLRGPLPRRDGRLRDRDGGRGLRPGHSPGLHGRRHGAGLPRKLPPTRRPATRRRRARRSWRSSRPAAIRRASQVATFSPDSTRSITPDTGAYGDGSTFSEAFAILAVVGIGRLGAGGGHRRARALCRTATAAGATARRPWRRAAATPTRRPSR